MAEKEILVHKLPRVKREASKGRQSHELPRAKQDAKKKRPVDLFKICEKYAT